MDTISSKDARDHMGELLNEVAYGHKRYYITRHGNEIAVLISKEEWVLIMKYLEQKEMEEDIRDADIAMKRVEKEGTISHKELKRKLDL